MADRPTQYYLTFSLSLGAIVINFKKLILYGKFPPNFCNKVKKNQFKVCAIEQIYWRRNLEQQK